MHKVIARRRAEQERLIATARRYVAALSTRMPLVAAAVAGSVARGDFNVWSDIDVVVVAEGLPRRYLDRAGLLLTTEPGVQAVGYTPEEFRQAFAKGNALVREAVAAGVPLAGEAFLREVAASASEARRG